MSNPNCPPQPSPDDNKYPHFTVGGSSFGLSYYTKMILFSIIIAVIIVWLVMGNMGTNALVVTFLLTVIMYILLTSASGSNLAGSLPFATYPLPPHLGLDGVARVTSAAF